MADEDDRALARFALLQRPRDALVAGADIVDAGEVGVAVEQVGRLTIGLFAVVLHLAQFDDLQVRKLLGRMCRNPISRSSWPR